MGGLDVVEPSDCAVLLGLGLAGPELDTERKVPGTFAYNALTRHGAEAAFERAARHVVSVLASVAAMGSAVFGAINLDTIRHAAARHRALVFVTHHAAGRVQCGPAMIPVTEVLAAIRAGYDGVIDLGACDTKESVAAELRAACPHARGILFHSEHHLVVRASYIRAVQRHLRFAPRPYVRAAADVLVEMSLGAQRACPQPQETV